METPEVQGIDVDAFFRKKYSEEELRDLNTGVKDSVEVRASLAHVPDLLPEGVEANGRQELAAPAAVIGKFPAGINVSTGSERDSNSNELDEDELSPKSAISSVDNLMGPGTAASLLKRSGAVSPGSAPDRRHNPPLRILTEREPSPPPPGPDSTASILNEMVAALTDADSPRYGQAVSRIQTCILHFIHDSPEFNEELVRKIAQVLYNQVLVNKASVLADVVKEVLTTTKRTSVKWGQALHAAILDKCQQTFEKRNLLPWPGADGLSEDKQRAKQQWLNLLCFLGELFNRGLLSDHILTFCIAELLGLPRKLGKVVAVVPSDRDLEGVSILLSSCGKEMERRLNEYAVVAFFDRLSHFQQLCTQPVLKEILAVPLQARKAGWPVSPTGGDRRTHDPPSPPRSPPARAGAVATSASKAGGISVTVPTHHHQLSHGLSSPLGSVTSPHGMGVLISGAASAGLPSPTHLPSPTQVGTIGTGMLKASTPNAASTNAIVPPAVVATAATPSASSVAAGFISPFSSLHDPLRSSQQSKSQPKPQQQPPQQSQPQPQPQAQQQQQPQPQEEEQQQQPRQPSPPAESDEEGVEEKPVSTGLVAPPIPLSEPHVDSNKPAASVLPPPPVPLSQPPTSTSPTPPAPAAQAQQPLTVPVPGAPVQPVPTSPVNVLERLKQAGFSEAVLRQQQQQQQQALQEQLAPKAQPADEEEAVLGQAAHIPRAALNPSAPAFVPGATRPGGPVGGRGVGIGRHPQHDSDALQESSKDRTVYVVGIDTSLPEKTLLSFVQSCGRLLKIRLCGDTNNRTIYGFFEYKTRREAQNLMDKDKQPLGKYILNCSWAKAAIRDAMTGSANNKVRNYRFDDSGEETTDDTELRESCLQQKNWMPRVRRREGNPEEFPSGYRREGGGSGGDGPPVLVKKKGIGRAGDDEGAVLLRALEVPVEVQEGAERLLGSLGNDSSKDQQAVRQLLMKFSGEESEVSPLDVAMAALFMSVVSYEHSTRCLAFRLLHACSKASRISAYKCWSEVLRDLLRTNAAVKAPELWTSVASALKDCVISHPALLQRTSLNDLCAPVRRSNQWAKFRKALQDAFAAVGVQGTDFNTIVPQ